MLPHLVTTVTGLVAIATEGIRVSARARASPLARVRASVYTRLDSLGTPGLHRR